MKFEGFRLDELQYVATLMAGRDLERADEYGPRSLYAEIIKEIRNRRIKEELFQMKLE